MNQNHIIDLQMKINNENDEYYIEKLNALIYESNNNILEDTSKNERYLEPRQERKGCWEWFKGILGCEDVEDNEETSQSPFVGLNNIGNNCYLNAGLQILSRCYPLLLELLKCNYEKDELIRLFVEIMIALLFKKDKYYNPSRFVDLFCRRNEDFIIGKQNCSQDFIRTILRNINEIFERKISYKNYNPNNKEELNAYGRYVLDSNIFPESKAFSIFSGILKIHINGICSNCNTEVNNYSFSNFVDQILYLDSFSTKCRLSDVLTKNFGNENKATMNCPKCKAKINCKSISKFVKIPEIFIFTLERFLIRNKVPIEPNEIINVYNYVDETLNINRDICKYELFAINVRLGEDISFGHEICHIKEKNQWWTINDRESHLKYEDYNQNSYGLFYRRIRNES